MASLATRLSAALLACALVGCTNGGDPKESGNMTSGNQAAGGTGSADTAGSAMTQAAPPTVPTGAGSDTGPKPSCCSSQKADTSKKTP